MRAKRGRAAAFAVGAGCSHPAAPAFGAGSTDGQAAALPDRDVRVAQLQSDRGTARRMRAPSARRWRGTSSARPRRSSTRAARSPSASPGGSAEAAARAFVDANARPVPRRRREAAPSSSATAELAGGAGHAVTLRQVVGGLEAAGGGMLTVGLQQEGAALEGHLRRGQPARRRHAGRQGHALGPGGRPARRRRHRQAPQRSARSSGSPSRPARASRPSRSPGSATSSAPARSRSRRSTAASCPPSRPTCSTPRARRRAATAPTSTPATARCSPARASSTRPRTRSPRRSRRSRSPASCPRPTAAARRSTARTPSPPTRAIRAIDVFVDADVPGAGHRAPALPRHDAPRRGRHQLHPRADPLRARRATSCPPATTSSRSASSATAPRRSSRAPTRARSRSTTARPPRRTRPAGWTSRARRSAARWRSDPWNVPDTDVREHWCWKPSSGVGRRLRRDRRQPRLALAVGPRRQG